MKLLSICLLSLGFCVVSPFSLPLNAAPHRYDHVVIVVEENRTVGEIIGDRVNAPYINTLADGGVRLSSMYAITHPSQPNYIHLFSGGNQGVINDNLPPNFSTIPTSSYPFRAPNMGAEIIAAGFSFAGFSEQLEAAGANDWADYDPHTASDPGILYRRRHNPWANWVAKVSPIPANQLPSTANKAFTQFPTNFADLPTVCFVVPNLDHDMHNGSRKEGDEWLRTNSISSYATWAKTNNSLLIITWDEDDYDHVNQIATVLYGAGLRDGTATAGTWTLHNLLRTIEDMYASGHAGSAAQVRSIVGPFTNDPPLTIVTFRQALNGYSGGHDTQVWAEMPDSTFGTVENLTADLDTSSSLAGNQEGEVLVRFDSLFGTNATQVPPNATVHSAKLILYTPLVAGNESSDVFGLHRMIMDWSESVTWNSLTNGVSTDNVEAATAASFSLVPSVTNAPQIFDVTGDIELFQSGTPNRGWVIRSTNTGSGNGWTFKSSETTADLTQRPRLEIIYSITPYAAWANSKNLTGTDSAPTADPDHDGANNLTEFAYNMQPLVADARAIAPTGTNGLPAAHYLTQSGGILEIEFVRRKGPSAVGLTYGAQFSDNLVNGWASGQAPNVTSLNSDWERVTVRDNAPGPNSERFGKVVVSLQQ